MRSKPGLSPTKILVGLSLCFASTVSFSAPAAAAICQAGDPGCVLPVRDRVAEAPPPVQQPPPPIIEEDVDGGFFDGAGWLLGLLALAALVAGILLLTGDDDDEPISP